LLKKIGTYKFGKFEEINQLNFKPVFLENGLIFFDKKGSIIRYNNNKKILWKKNHYSKVEKKQKPKLNFVLDAENLLVTDSVAKYYSININTGELNWTKNNTYPFNSDIKKHKDKFFVIDYKNTLRCYEIKNGNECWNLKTEDSFTISNSKLSLIIVDDLVVFSNSIGDITAVDIETGLIIWQLPTQSSSIINETYNFKISKLVSDGNSIYFSNNKNEFYSIDLKNGIINWKNEISSNITPVITGNLIFTVSEDGYLLVIEKNKGNIIRVTDLLKNYKLKKRKDIKPVGFAIDDTTLYLTNSDGKMILVDLSTGKIKTIEKVSGDFISRPFIFSQNLFVIRNGSIVQYN
jgi:outer membrane protein assembly factor BamB